MTTVDNEERNRAYLVHSFMSPVKMIDFKQIIVYGRGGGQYIV